MTSLGTADGPDDEPFGLAALAESCRLPSEKMLAVVGAVRDAVGQWRESASRNGIRDVERSLFEESFRAGSSVLDAVLSTR